MLQNHQAIIVDRSSQIVLGSYFDPRISKLVSSSILDSFVLCFPNSVLSENLKNFEFKKNEMKNFKYLAGTDFVEIPNDINSEIIKKQAYVSLRKYAAIRLLNRIDIMTTSFDYMSDLNIDDISNYENYRDDLINLYSFIKQQKISESTKHLDLVHQSNKNLLLKRYNLLWKYNSTLSEIVDKETLKKWIDKFELETYTIYRI